MGYRLSDYEAEVVKNQQLTDTLFLMELDVAPLSDLDDSVKDSVKDSVNDPAEDSVKDSAKDPVKGKGELAACIEPGQFVHVSIPTTDSHILRRPFSIYAVDRDANRVEILYQVLGSGTEEMSRWEVGQTTSMIGPIGNGWKIPDGCKRALLVGGGVGAAPLFMLYEKLISQGVDVDVVLGAASASALVCRDRYGAVCGKQPQCSTDDGSFGREGFCTLLVEDAINDSVQNNSAYDFAAICGPEPLMRIASKMVREAGIPCQVSLERRMACGVGACLSCVVDTVEGKKRSCVDGPVFDAEAILW